MQNYYQEVVLALSKKCFYCLFYCSYYLLFNLMMIVINIQPHSAVETTDCLW